ncbi:nuclear transport factor 2 family protein [Pseudonocardia acaciae]|uniref:nuclear transport factor 2 family protein n=1 Tax=Pseudonocardia acaciae TaxID=551276 RepID=UPI0004911888|nr:nuclear transport factor 2 family protein [Pseudonocardia acaciae]
MTTTPPTVAHRFATAFNTRDVERLVKVFTPDIAYHDLFYGVFEGHAGLRELFTRMYAEGTHHEWTMTRVATGEHSTIGEWRFEFTLSDAVPHGAGRTLRFPGVSVFETRGDRCHTYREYFDRTAALLAVGIAPGSVAGIVRRRPTIEVAMPESGTLVR